MTLRAVQCPGRLDGSKIHARCLACGGVSDEGNEGDRCARLVTDDAPRERHVMTYACPECRRATRGTDDERPCEACANRIEAEQARDEIDELVARGYLPIRTCDGCLGQVDHDDPSARQVAGYWECGECARALDAEQVTP